MAEKPKKHQRHRDGLPLKTNRDKPARVSWPKGQPSGGYAGPGLLHCHCSREARGGPCSACQHCQVAAVSRVDDLLYPGPDSSQHPPVRKGKAERSTETQNVVFTVHSLSSSTGAHKSAAGPCPGIQSVSTELQSLAWDRGGGQGCAHRCDKGCDRRVAATSAGQTTAVPTTFCCPKSC